MQVVLTTRRAGLSNQLFVLVTGIIEARQRGIKQVTIGPFSPHLQSNVKVSADQIFDLAVMSRSLNMQLKAGSFGGQSIFAWYTVHGEAMFVEILRKIRFNKSFYGLIEELNIIDKSQPLHVIHLRIEQDALKYWSQLNKMIRFRFRELLLAQYREAIKRIPAGEQILILSYDTNDPFIEELRETYTVITVDGHDLSEGRELSAIIDLLLGLECTGVFVGCHNFRLHRGSSFSYVLWQLMKKVKQGIFIDLDCIKNPLQVFLNKSVVHVKVYIYFHICTIGTWRKIVNKLYQRIANTGLIDLVDRIYVTVLGVHINEVRAMLNHPKIEILYSSPDVGVYERKCLMLLREHAGRENAKFLYIHSKGITKPYPGVDDWIELLMYFTINEYESCLAELDTFDTVGVNLKLVPHTCLHSASLKDGSKSHHYSGNFWWAKSSYLMTLPTIIGPKYLDPEVWIGSGIKKKMLSLWQSNVGHYNVRYPMRNYLGKKQRHVINI